ncbi:PDR/VanB family oxidoreductase [Celeribacter indicus]|uniref:Ferredoxin n=1 Tax=Celeribacter indicus TaxID=1208324 RepID=A0A0B5DV09_9RHOB|nr:PDR/VanB family oxidoreductase [Celeribacter indicus]AJE45050.1 ferredoxin [Celeribacter indicus]SDX42140.1 vanillate O-demethylase ferredoxin subunit [Celeribacter indicus]
MEIHDFRIARSAPIAEDTRAIRLEPVDGTSELAFAPGDHVRLVLPSGEERAYSLVNAPADLEGYEIAVQVCPDGTGGSRELCSLAAGTAVGVHTPRNAFRLHDGPGVSVLVAGGIGITPIWCMAQSLAREGRPWRLYYAARRAERAPFLAEVRALAADCGAEVEIAFSDQGERLDLTRIVGGIGPKDHLYCCGPDTLLDDFRAATFMVSDRAHTESFAVAEAAEGGFEVELAQSGLVLTVPEGYTILETVLEQGILVEYSCMGGTCGSCATRVLEGTPDHRDSYLSEEEKAAGDKMLICCSGSLTPRLVLDL